MSMSISGMGGAYMPPQVMSGASSRMSPDQKMSNVFQQIDTSGSGTISKAQFEQAFQSMNPPAAFKSMGADAVFSKLDVNGTGSVSKQDFVNGMKNLMKEVHHHHRQAADASGGTAPSPAQTLSGSLGSLNSIDAKTGLGPSGTNLNVTA